MCNSNILDAFHIVRKDAVVWMFFIFVKISLILYAFFILMVLIFKKFPFGRHYNDYITTKDLGMFLFSSLAIFSLLGLVVLYKLIIMIHIIKNRQYLTAELLETGHYLSKDCRYFYFKYLYRGKEFYGISAYHQSAYEKMPINFKETMIMINSRKPKRLLPVEIMGISKKYFR